MARNVILIKAHKMLKKMYLVQFIKLIFSLASFLLNTVSFCFFLIVFPFNTFISERHLQFPMASMTSVSVQSSIWLVNFYLFCEDILSFRVCPSQACQGHLHTSLPVIKWCNFYLLVKVFEWSRPRSTEQSFFLRNLVIVNCIHDCTCKKTCLYITATRTSVAYFSLCQWNVFIEKAVMISVYSNSCSGFCL